MFGRNGRFLLGAFHRFFREDLLSLLRRYGVETVVERGGRLYPRSGRAADVVAALRAYGQTHGVTLCLRAAVTQICVRQGRVTGVCIGDRFLPGQAVVLAAGGASWPETGSTGDGYRLAAGLGHTIVPLRPALVPLVAKDRERTGALQGVTLRNVRLTAFQCPAADIRPAMVPAAVCGRGISGRKPRPPVLESRLGEMAFTPFGMAGSVTLLESLAAVDALARGPVSLAVDLKPGLTARQLDLRLQRDLAATGASPFAQVLSGLLPRVLVLPVAALSGISADKPACQVTARERERVGAILKLLAFDVAGSLPLDAALVTAGGVCLREVDPRTMGSRRIRGLFFCGEVLDIDADTGGYNLQAAFSTGAVVGASALDYARGQDP